MAQRNTGFMFRSENLYNKNQGNFFRLKSEAKASTALKMPHSLNPKDKPAESGTQCIRHRRFAGESGLRSRSESFTLRNQELDCPKSVGQVSSSPQRG